MRMNRAAADTAVGTGVVARLDAVVTHHRDGFRSGVARFNEILAARLDVPLYGIDERALTESRCPLFSFKVAEMRDDEAGQAADRIRAREGPWEVFLHEFRALPLELMLVERAQRVHCGNHEIAAQIADLTNVAQTLWSPGLILEERSLDPREVTVFSFGMAHKLRADMFRRLKELLDADSRSYGVLVSTANHETTRMQDAQLVYDEMHQIFPGAAYFLGNLSDLAVLRYLDDATFFAAFFLGGVRANNGSVAAAMERGAVVITNLDEHSPPEYVHMDNLIDVKLCTKLPRDPLVLARIRVRAMETALSRAWPHLLGRLSGEPQS